MGEASTRKEGLGRTRQTVHAALCVLMHADTFGLIYTSYRMRQHAGHDRKSCRAEDAVPAGGHFRLSQSEGCYSYDCVDGLLLNGPVKAGLEVLPRPTRSRFASTELCSLKSLSGFLPPRETLPAILPSLKP